MELNFLFVIESVLKKVLCLGQIVCILTKALESTRFRELYTKLSEVDPFSLAQVPLENFQLLI